MDILVVDLARVLDETAFGKRATAELRASYDASREKLDGLRAQAKSAPGALQKQATKELQETERASLTALDEKKSAARTKLLAEARAVIEQVRAERGARLVLDASAVVLAPEASDITALVMAKLDEKLA